MGCCPKLRHLCTYTCCRRRRSAKKQAYTENTGKTPLYLRFADNGEVQSRPRSFSLWLWGLRNTRKQEHNPTRTPGGHPEQPSTRRQRSIVSPCRADRSTPFAHLTPLQCTRVIRLHLHTRGLHPPDRQDWPCRKEGGFAHVLPPGGQGEGGGARQRPPGTKRGPGPPVSLFYFSFRGLVWGEEGGLRAHPIPLLRHMFFVCRKMLGTIHSHFPLVCMYVCTSCLASPPPLCFTNGAYCVVTGKNARGRNNTHRIRTPGPS